MRLLTLAGLFWILVCPARADALVDELVLGSGFRSGPVNSHEYLVDHDKSLTLAAASSRTDWRLSGNKTLNFGVSDAAVWVRFELVNPTQQEQSLLLEFAQPLLDQIDLALDYANAPDRQVVVGDSVPRFGRLLRHGNFLVPVSIPPGDRLTVTGRVFSKTTLQIPIRLWRYQDFIESNFFELTLYGVFFGLLFAIGLYHLFIFVAVKEKSFLYYALTNLSLLGIFLSLRGVPGVFFWPGEVFVNDLFLLYSICGGVLFPCLFTRDVLIIPQVRPFLAKVLNSVTGAAVAVAVVVPFIDYHILVLPLLALATISLAVNGFSHVIRFLDGYLPAKYVLLAGIFTIIGLVVAVLEKTGFLPSNELTIGASYLGVSIMTMLYSFALAYRMTMDRDLRLKAQEESVKAQQELIESQRKLNAELDQRVHERTEELQLLNARLKVLSTTDSLTQLRNRHFFDEVFASEFSRGYRERTPIAILLMDLDHFKRLNDTYGHLFGDACLQQVGTRIRQIVKRPSDVAARYGGEEFIILLNNTGIEGARNVAEQIHQAFSCSPITWGEQTVTVTVSIGVVSVVPDDSNSYETIIKAADDLLYQAKANGRNQVLARALDG